MTAKIRLYIATLAAILSTPILCQGPTLNLDQALAKGLNQADLRAILESRDHLADSAIEAQRAWDNPSLFLAQETDDLMGIRTEERFLTISQRVALFGTRRLRIQAAQHEKNAVLQENQLQEIQVAAQIKTHFFQALHAQKRLKILQNWVHQTQGLFNQILNQERSGQASGLDRRRLERELHAAKANFAKESANFAAHWQQLATWLLLEEPHVLEGSLLPTISESANLARMHPTLRALEETQQAAVLHEKIAGKWILPEITFEAGIKQIKSLGSTDRGTVLSVNLPLPVLNRNKAGLMQARAKARLAQNEKSLAQRQLASQRSILRNKIKAHLVLHQTLYAETIHLSQEMVDIAKAAYAAGEMTLTHFFEAQHDLRDAQLASLSFQAETRLLAIDLEQLEVTP